MRPPLADLNKKKMIVVSGTVVKKVRLQKPLRVEILIKDKDGDPLSLQLRPAKLDKLVEIDVGTKIEFKVKNQMSKTHKNYINNLIVTDAQVL